MVSSEVGELGKKYFLHIVQYDNDLSICIKFQWVYMYVFFRDKNLYGAFILLFLDAKFYLMQVVFARTLANATVSLYSAYMCIIVIVFYQGKH